MTTFVFGHKSPDTDSTGSPIIWAWYLTEVQGKSAEARLLGEPNTEAAWMLERFGFDKPALIDDVEDGQRVVIVDTNNPAELPENINKADIRAIIDHHRLVGGIETKSPVTITMEPLACTATIMHRLMGDDGDLGIEISAFASEMFAAKSDVSAFSEAELLRMDSKEFETGGTTFRVSVLETTSPQTVLSRKDALLAAMPEVAREDGVDQVLLFVVDILREEATLLVPNDLVRSVAEKSFATVCPGDTIVLPGIVSRKKQIIPNLAV